MTVRQCRTMQSIPKAFDCDSCGFVELVCGEQNLQQHAFASMIVAELFEQTSLWLPDAIQMLPSAWIVFARVLCSCNSESVSAAPTFRIADKLASSTTFALLTFCMLLCVLLDELVK